MSLSLALAVQAIEKKSMLKSDTRRLTVVEKRAVVKFIVVVVALRGNEGEARISPLLVDCQNSRSLCRFYSRLLSRSLRAWNPSSSGDSGLFPGTFFFSKSRVHGSPLEPMAFSVVGTLENPGDTWRANDCAPEKDFYPTGGPRGGSSSVYAHVPSHGTRPSEDLRLRFPGRKRENAPRPLWRKSALDFWREAPVTGVLDVYIFENAVRSTISETLISRVKSIREFLFIYLLFVLYTYVIYSVYIFYIFICLYIFRRYIPSFFWIVTRVLERLRWHLFILESFKNFIFSSRERIISQSTIIINGCF